MPDSNIYMSRDENHEYHEYPNHHLNQQENYGYDQYQQSNNNNTYYEEDLRPPQPETCAPPAPQPNMPAPPPPSSLSPQPLSQSLPSQLSPQQPPPPQILHAYSPKPPKDGQTVHKIPRKQVNSSSNTPSSSTVRLVQPDYEPAIESSSPSSFSLPLHQPQQLQQSQQQTQPVNQFLMPQEPVQISVQPTMPPTQTSTRPDPNSYEERFLRIRNNKTVSISKALPVTPIEQNLPVIQNQTVRQVAKPVPKPVVDMPDPQQYIPTPKQSNPINDSNYMNTSNYSSPPRKVLNKPLPIPDVPKHMPLQLPEVPSEITRMNNLSLNTPSTPKSAPKPMNPSYQMPSPSFQTPEFNFTPSPTITPEHLRELLLKYPDQILVIDIRSRQFFNEGHLPSSTAICFEPIAIHRSVAVTVETLEDALVMSPKHEQDLFKRRHTFELVVYYDANMRSTEFVRGKCLNEQEEKMSIFVDYVHNKAHTKQLKRMPSLLVGGLEKWISLYGKNSLWKSDANSYRASASNNTTNMNGNGSLVSNGSAVVTNTRLTSERFKMESPPQTLWNKKYSDNPISAPTPPQTIPSRPYGSRKGSVASSNNRLSFDGAIDMPLPLLPSLTPTSTGGSLSALSPHPALPPLVTTASSSPGPASPSSGPGYSTPRQQYARNTSDFFSMTRNSTPQSLQSSYDIYGGSANGLPSTMYSKHSRNQSRDHSRDHSRTQSRDTSREHSRDYSNDLSKGYYNGSANGSLKDARVNGLTQQPADMPKIPPKVVHVPPSQSQDPHSGINSGYAMGHAQGNRDAAIYGNGMTPSPGQAPQNHLGYPGYPGYLPHQAPSYQALIPSFTTGLTNLGNTCYINCILQCIVGTQKLTQTFFEKPDLAQKNSRLGYGGVLYAGFWRLLREMASRNNRHVSPVMFRDLCGSICDTFKGYEQQDCQEFLNFLLDGLHEELNVAGHKAPLKPLTEKEELVQEQLSLRVASANQWKRYLYSNNSPITTVVQGQYLSRLTCTVCHRTSTTYNAFSSLTLPIPLNVNTCTLEDCFAHFTKPEYLEGDNAWLCPGCKCRQKTVKQMLISRLPSVLVIHLKRFRVGNRFGSANGGGITSNIGNRISSSINGGGNLGSSKLETTVIYPVDPNGPPLDLTKYWVPPTSPEDLAVQHGSQTPPFLYKLYATATHNGTLKGGHYTSYVKRGSSGWCYFDDTKVYKNVDWRRVVNKNTYVLFFERVKPVE